MFGHKFVADAAAIGLCRLVMTAAAARRQVRPRRTVRPPPRRTVRRARQRMFDAGALSSSCSA